MINKITLIGNLGQDPDLRRLENGTHVCRMSVATNESYKDKQSDEWIQDTQWHTVIAWRHLADRCGKMMKGQQVYVEGKLTHRKYTDKQGVERYVSEVVASKVYHLGKSDNRPPMPESPYTGGQETSPAIEEQAHLAGVKDGNNQNYHDDQEPPI